MEKNWQRNNKLINEEKVGEITSFLRKSDKKLFFNDNIIIRNFDKMVHM